ncbi:PadR family transcriptional regulator [Helcobacillus massiliensis]|uniref:PadR family transcriptional regulator n=1 Tax=Helcobacillus TaxID=1161125 RepID=UPI001EF5A547|nr:PadR family transcriptional regulator [Helcobacillus massiliensis]MCG7426065.1 PadR family transcriptional regulator [Helcobacillus sp. ACRRO]MCT1558367.1 PadR family transcriptional regulator [Helcobacillus massiliensis]MCT2036861.1 PadR family transcriptional regulator [Helcobacillus massiliensis]MCT2332642.1 PadR family transcriptional regulator [Helcobacillus massiliensis]MDK7741506.1 PadR family transcriptional regulator [Helcobacillus massiliensis]
MNESVRPSKRAAEPAAPAAPAAPGAAVPPVVPQAWARAVMPTAILACLTAEDLHGYALALRLDERGLGKPKGGSLYPVLARLEADGCITATWVDGDAGPGRKQYAITAAGRDRLADERAAWTAVRSAIAPHSTGQDSDQHEGEDS